MSRSRTIKPGFFQNEDLADCSPFARLMFAGLWCIADREGRVEDRPRRVKASLFPYNDVDADALLSELASKGFITRYIADGIKCIQVNKFEIHQNPHPREQKSVLPPQSREKVCTSREKALPSNLTLGRGNQELREEEKQESKEEEKQETREADPIPPHKLDPNFDSRVDEIWPKVVEVHSQSRPAGSAPKLNGYRKRAMSAALDEYEPKEILEAWRWAMSSPDFVAESIRGAKGIDTFLGADKLAGYIEAASNPARWKAQSRAGPVEADPIEQYFATSASKGKP